MNFENTEFRSDVENFLFLYKEEQDLEAKYSTIKKEHDNKISEFYKEMARTKWNPVTKDRIYGELDDIICEKRAIRKKLKTIRGKRKDAWEKISRIIVKSG